ncbi:hypothetical protein BS47DRAFT_1345921 [Hydnum rufescens UP504]|uniref:Uncharacterized protein n=1 Tax=Hydnum rufescens UP504 TaxID=1448309 RepID=A0A9P6AVE5_9AGAM|nr:hypothetical protein BS47DRAFT_1345921 [Hydnum rufescens UP504]
MASLRLTACRLPPGFPLFLCFSILEVHLEDGFSREPRAPRIIRVAPEVESAIVTSRHMAQCRRLLGGPTL